MERLVNIIRQRSPRVIGEDTSLKEALEQENRVMMAFFEGKISVDEYYQYFEETSPITHTEYKGFVFESDRRK